MYGRNSTKYRRREKEVGYRSAHIKSEVAYHFLKKQLIQNTKTM